MCNKVIVKDFISPHLKPIAALPCETKCQETSDKPKCLFNNKFKYNLI